MCNRPTAVSSSNIEGIIKIVRLSYLFSFFFRWPHFLLFRCLQNRTDVTFTVQTKRQIDLFSVRDFLGEIQHQQTHTHTCIHIYDTGGKLQLMDRCSNLNVKEKRKRIKGENKKTFFFFKEKE